jgi:hypothetical protein
MYFGESFMRAKQNLFNVIAAAKDENAALTTSWKIKYFGQAPQIATIRELTEAEKTEKANLAFKGVRTFYFQAHHWRGLPQLSAGDMEEAKHDYDDFVWVPKRKMNEYLSKEYYEIFIKGCTTR